MNSKKRKSPFTPTKALVDDLQDFIKEEAKTALFTPPASKRIKLNHSALSKEFVIKVENLAPTAFSIKIS